MHTTGNCNKSLKATMVAGYFPAMWTRPHPKPWQVSVVLAKVACRPSWRAGTASFLGVFRVL